MKSNRATMPAVPFPIVGVFLRKWIVLMATLTCLWITGEAQQRTVVVLPSSSVSLSELINAIETQTSYSFSYSSRVDLSTTVKLAANKMTTVELLESLRATTGIAYQIKDNKIILKPAGRRHTIHGYLRDATDNENLIGGNIYTRDLLGTTTNAFGHFSLTLDEGEVELTASYVGYEPLVSRFVLSKDTTIQLFMRGRLLDEVVIEEEVDREPIHEMTQMSSITLPVRDLKSIPAMGGEVDVLRSLSLLPGVQTGSEGNSGLYVRGGGPDQNLILLDGVPVYNASHLFGFFSVFNSDAINHVELIKGGFPARYGGRLSSVVDINLKEGSRERFKGEGSVGLIASRLTLESPLFKKKGSFIVSGRRTYADIVAQPFLRKKDNRIGYYFYDFNAKFNYTFNANNRVYVSTYSGKDDASSRDRSTGGNPGAINQRTSSESSIGWNNLTAVARWNHVIHPRLFLNVSATYTKYRFRIASDYRSDMTTPYGDRITQFSTARYYSGIEDYSAKADFDYLPNARHYVKFGVYTTRHLFRPGVSSQQSEVDPEPEVIGSRQVGQEYGAYAEDDWMLTRKLKVNAGVHFSAYFIGNSSYYFPQPRIAARYLLTPALSVKASYSEMAQYLHLLTNSGVGLPTDLWVPATERIKPQTSRQVAAGAAWSPGKMYELTLEGYYKTMDGVIEYKDGASFLGTQQDWQDKVEVGKGESYGAEWLAQKRSGVVTGWIGYTLSWTYRQFENLNGGKRFPYRYDRRHDVEVVGNWNINPRVQLSGTWVYGTGNAITLPVGQYSSLAFAPVFSGTNNYYTDFYSSRNAFRLRAYHRLDVSLTLKKQTRWGERDWVFSIYNVYSRRNPYYVDLLPDSKSVVRLYQFSLFPIIPTITYNFRF